MWEVISLCVLNIVHLGVYGNTCGSRNPSVSSPSLKPNLNFDVVLYGHNKGKTKKGNPYSMSSSSKNYNKPTQLIWGTLFISLCVNFLSASFVRSLFQALLRDCKVPIHHFANAILPQAPPCHKQQCMRNICKAGSSRQHEFISHMYYLHEPHEVRNV